jgi:hypothetical protein
MKVVRVKILGKVENLVCRILRVLSTVNKSGLTSTTSEGSDSKEHGQSYLVYKDAEWLKKKGVTDLVNPPTNPGTYGGTTHNALEVHKAAALAWKRYKEAQSATKTMIMYAFKPHHFLELEDDNGDIRSKC